MGMMVTLIHNEIIKKNRIKPDKLNVSYFQSNSIFGQKPTEIVYQYQQI